MREVGGVKKKNECRIRSMGIDVSVASSIGSLFVLLGKSCVLGADELVTSTLSCRSSARFHRHDAAPDPQLLVDQQPSSRSIGVWWRQ